MINMLSAHDVRELWNILPGFDYWGRCQVTAITKAWVYGWPAGVGVLVLPANTEYPRSGLQLCILRAPRVDPKHAYMGVRPEDVRVLWSSLSGTTEVFKSEARRILTWVRNPNGPELFRMLKHYKDHQATCAGLHELDARLERKPR